MNNQFISISEAVTRYKISQSKVRKIVKDNKGTEHIKQVSIKGKHGFKYLISISFLNTILNPNTETSSKKESIKKDNQKDNQLITQLTNENSKLNIQIDNQNQIINKLTDTIQEQNKAIISQSMQIHHLTSSIEQPSNEQNGKTNFELIMIFILVCCMVAAIAYLLI